MTTTPDRLHTLDRLVGTWAISGQSNGTVRYEWMDGGKFLVQHVELVQDDEVTRGVEYIGGARRTACCARTSSALRGDPGVRVRTGR